MSSELRNNSLTKEKKQRAMLKGAVDLQRIAAAVREILAAIGEDPQREGLRDTPDRVARMYEEMFSGLRRIRRGVAENLQREV